MLPHLSDSLRGALFGCDQFPAPRKHLLPPTPVCRLCQRSEPLFLRSGMLLLWLPLVKPTGPGRLSHPSSLFRYNQLLTRGVRAGRQLWWCPTNQPTSCQFDFCLPLFLISDSVFFCGYLIGARFARGWRCHEHCDSGRWSYGAHSFFWTPTAVEGVEGWTSQSGRWVGIFEN